MRIEYGEGEECSVWDEGSEVGRGREMRVG